MGRVPVLAIALLLASGGLTGFVYLKTRGGKPEPVVHLDRVAQAVATTSSTKSFTFRYSATISAADLSLRMTGDGSYDLGRGLGEMRMHFGSAPGLPAGGDVGIVVDTSHGLVEYMNATFLQGHLPAGKSWVKIDVGALGKKAGIDLSRLEQSNSADPTQAFLFLRRSANPTVVGQESVGGVATTHYRATVNLWRLVAAETDEATRENLQRAIELSGISSYPVEAWVDRAGYLRRMQITMPQVAGGTDTGVVSMTMTEELANFGAAVTIAVPPDASVVDVADL